MVFLLALDLAVISKAQNLLPIEGLKEIQTMAKEKESTLSNSEKIGILKDDIGLVITCVLSELKDQLEDDCYHDISLSSPSNSMLYYKVYLLLMSFFIVTEESVDQQNTEHDTFTLQLRERDKQIEELKQSLKGN